MKLNKDAHIGNVLFVVEGSQTEFSILHRIFCNILGYTYIEKRRNQLKYFQHQRDKYSTIAVVNPKESNIQFIENSDYFDEIFNTLRDRYQFPVEQAAIYFLFDRDPKSNTDVALIQDYILSLKNPYENADGYVSGQLLLSYPSIESYTISNFVDHSSNLRFQLGKDAKRYIESNNNIQLNKMSDDTLIKATYEFLDYLENENIDLNLDDFSTASCTILTSQESEYLRGNGFKAFSMLTLALLQMNIIMLD